MAHAETSIVRIAGAGFRLSLLLNAAACQLAQSRIEIHSIAKGISLFALTLKHVGQTLEAADLDPSLEATEKACEIAGQGQMVFVEIQHMLDKLQGTDTDDELKRIPMQDRLKWCFRKQHVTYLLAQVESLKLGLIVMLRILQLGNLIKSSPASTEPNTPDLLADDVIAQDKAETQNMIIVRYWSVKRLDRLWDFVEQEAAEAVNNQTNQRIISNFASNAESALKPLVDAMKGTNLSKPHAVTFGEVDIGLSDIERSPKDMVHLSEQAMNRLLSLWVESLRVQNSEKLGQDPLQLRPFISSGSEDDLADLDYEGQTIRGYYLDGNTVDWRKPQSQEARQHAAEMRRRFLKYQAHVDSDSESEDGTPVPNPRPVRPRTAVSDEGEQRTISRHPSNASSTNGRSHANSLPPRYQPSQNWDSRPAVSFPPGSAPVPRSAPAYLKPPSHAPVPPPPPYKHHSQDYTSAPRSIPRNPSSPTTTMANPSPRGTAPNQFEHSWSRQQGYDRMMPQPRHHPSVQFSSSHPETSLRPSPPRSVQRSPSHSSRRSSREEAKDRQKNLTRNATRGLVGIGAIAGFMDALEAFSIL
ncbi:hypothetical protein N7492_002696 [Penicillium capsulatum]|uniref:Uncharacterized protein n=1 Tax=Penicillium capsulatum TaxID=69766 RepID=A0A9W9LVF8_9EURO|nr:hypothetical protein N7492_002696 [Penicillium capsulatum]KAJ6122706.1 hypothetical protein N7512_005171 [Penicillium capsulatum]